MAIKQLVEKRNELAAKQKKLSEIFAEGKGDPTGSSQEVDIALITSLKGTNAEKLAEIRRLNEELDAIGTEVDALAIAETAEMNLAKTHDVKGGKDAPQPRFTKDESRPMGLGDLFVRSEAYKAWRPGIRKELSSEIKGGLPAMFTKADFVTTAGWAIENIRSGRVIEDAQRPIQVIDTIPGGSTTQGAIVYMEESTFTTAAAERAEAGAYAESALALTERTSTVRSIGTSLPVSDEQMADEAQVASYLNMRLSFMVRQRLDSQLLVGDGNAPNLTGINNLTGILTQAKGTDPTLDAIYKGMRQVRVTGRAVPSVVYVHPNDWEDIRLLRTADGVYIWGNPSEAGPMRAWGVSVVETDAQTQNTILVSDSRNFLQLFMRQDITIEIGYVASDFLNGLQTVRAGVRAAFVGYRPEAAAQITGA